jgi:hypothetical protein
MRNAVSAGGPPAVMSELNRGARLLVLLLRRHGAGQRVRRMVAGDGRGRAAKPDALVQALRILLSHLGGTEDGRFEVGQSGEPCLTADEHRMLTVVAVARVGTEPRLDVPADDLRTPRRTLTRPDLAAAVQRAVMLVGRQPPLPGPALRLVRVRGERVDHVQVAWP